MFFKYLRISNKLRDNQLVQETKINPRRLMSASFEQRRLKLLQEMEELLREAQERLHELGVPRIEEVPKKGEDIFIVRISAKEAVRDYKEMKEELKKDGKSIWDSDVNNRIGKGDWLGFIVGEDWRTADVELYRVQDIKPPSARKKSWAKQSHTAQPTDSVKDRDVLELSPLRSTVGWSWWKSVAGYKEKYVPRGTTKSKSPFH